MIQLYNKMKTLYLIKTNTLKLAEKDVSGSPRVRRNLADGQEVVAPDGHAYAVDVDQPIYDSDTVKLERKLESADGDYLYTWEEVELTSEEITARQPDPLTQARAGMSALLASLPVESRAKFADARAGIETMLDIGDFEGAHYRVGQIAVNAGAETTAKNTILSGLSNFL